MTEKKKIKVYLGWLSTGQREDVQLYLYRDLIDRYGHLIEFVLPEICVHRIFHDRARCEVVDEFLATDCDVLWFLDADVVPPHHVLDLIACHWDKWQVAGAPYPIYQSRPGTEEMDIIFTVYQGVGESGNKRGILIADVPQDGTAFVDGLATGCLFIKREVFEKLERPYFEFKFDPKTRVVLEGEDLGFALKCHDAGIKFFVDYSMACKHVKRVCLLEMANVAMKKRNNAILEYHKEVNDVVKKAQQDAYNLGYKKGLEAAAKASPAQPVSKSGLILPKHFSA